MALSPNPDDGKSGAIYQPGDVLQLNGGGPSLTVKLIEKRDGGWEYCCAWFREGALEEKYFKEVTLRRAPLQKKA